LIDALATNSVHSRGSEDPGFAKSRAHEIRQRLGSCIRRDQRSFCREQTITVAFVLTALVAASTAAAQERISFAGKTITMIVGFEPGGGTDTFGRLAASFLATGLPGMPSVLVRNVPGAEGITAMNYMVQQVAPDGLTITTSASTAADPLNYRKPQSHYDATSFAVVGGVGRGGSEILINKEAEARLHDRQARPVIVGSLGGVPRSGTQMAAWGSEFLGWNVKWVIGYRGTNELMLALERGEIDMTSTANLFLIQKLASSGRFKILVQTGTLKNGVMVARPDLGDAPVLANLLQGKIADPVARNGFAYWTNIATMDKWLALPPKTPQPLVDLYRDAYARTIQNPEFLERGKKTSDDFVPMLAGEVEGLVNGLGKTSPESMQYLNLLLKKQGLPVE
jgi:tripartite-type tricarboxylate transporter receptor subunit TctC